jgi:hypothetical protein
MPTYDFANIQHRHGELAHGQNFGVTGFAQAPAMARSVVLHLFAEVFCRFSGGIFTPASASEPSKLMPMFSWETLAICFCPPALQQIRQFGRRHLTHATICRCFRAPQPSSAQTATIEPLCRRTATEL